MKYTIIYECKQLSQNRMQICDKITPRKGKQIAFKNDKKETIVLSMNSIIELTVNKQV